MIDSKVYCYSVNESMSSLFMFNAGTMPPNRGEKCIVLMSLEGGFKATVSSPLPNSWKDNEGAADAETIGVCSLVEVETPFSALESVRSAARCRCCLRLSCLLGSEGGEEMCKSGIAEASCDCCLVAFTLVARRLDPRGECLYGQALPSIDPEAGVFGAPQRVESKPYSTGLRIDWLALSTVRASGLGFGLLRAGLLGRASSEAPSRHASWCIKS